MGSGGGSMNGTLASRSARQSPPVPQSLSVPSSGFAGGSASSSQRVADETSLEAPSAQALREMGFKEPQIRVAQELSRGRSSGPILQMLLRFQGVDSAIESDGEHLAKAIQEAVLHCDTAGYVSFG